MFAVQYEDAKNKQTEEKFGSYYRAIVRKNELMKKGYKVKISGGIERKVQIKNSSWPCCKAEWKIMGKLPGSQNAPHCKRPK